MKCKFKSQTLTPFIWHVIKNADIALYEAKNSGRNKIVEFKDIKDKDNGDNF